MEFEQLLSKNKTIAILDVRELDEYRSGHIPNAISLPLSIIQGQVSNLSLKEPYYVICYSGARSQRACQYLASHGFQVINVMGGMSAYRGLVSRSSR